MNAEHWIKFNKAASAFYYMYRNKPDAILSTGNTTDNFIENITRGLAHAHVFEISDTVKKLLMLTDPPNKNDDIPLPFQFFFLDVQFTKEELEAIDVHIKADTVTGVLVSKGQMVNAQNEQIVGTALRTTMFSELPTEEGWFDTFNTNINLDDEFMSYNIQKNPVTDEVAKRFVHKFVINFLNFIHNPEVRLVEHRRTEKSLERRKREGKVLIPSSSTIHVTGKLKQYIDEVDSGSHLGHFGFRFWIRGHFRRLMSDFYKEKKVIFVPPFLKGKGILVEKFYSVEKESNG